MLYREIIAVCSEIHTNHINTLCGQNSNLVVHIVASGLQSANDTNVSPIKQMNSKNQKCKAVHPVCRFVLCLITKIST